MEQLVLRWGPVAVVDPAMKALGGVGERRAGVATPAPIAAVVEGAVRAAALPVPRGGWLVRWKVPSGSRAGCLWTVARRADGSMG
jgi:hypothetical protein